MNTRGIECEIRNRPELDPGFLPLQRFNEAFLRTARVPVGIALERADGQMAAVNTFIHGTEAMREADPVLLEPIMKVCVIVLLYRPPGEDAALDERRLPHLCAGFRGAGRVPS